MQNQRVALTRRDTRVLKSLIFFVYCTSVYVLASEINTGCVVRGNNKLFTKLFELEIYEVGIR